MKTVYVLSVQGWGDNEYAFETVGVYSSKINAEMAQRNLIAEAHEDGLTDAVTEITTFEVDA